MRGTETFPPPPERGGIGILQDLIRKRANPMKQKLTITVDSELVHKAKRYARSHGVSLSSVIETELRDLVSGEALSFASRWRGEFEPAEREDPRSEALARKYL